MGGNAPQTAAKTAATSNDAAKSVPARIRFRGAPVGVAAPDDPLIADFDGGSCAAPTAIGWASRRPATRCAAAIPAPRRRWSTAEPAKSRGALEVIGNVGDGIQYPFAGTSFFPNGSPPRTGQAGPHGLLAQADAAFFRRAATASDYLVILMGPARTRFPPCTASPPARSGRRCGCRSPIFGGSTSSGCTDRHRHDEPPGAFRFQIDDVRVE